MLADTVTLDRRCAPKLTDSLSQSGELTILNLLPDPIFAAGLGNDGEASILFCNDAFAKLAGHDARDLIQAPIQRVFDHTMADMLRETMERTVHDKRRFKLDLMLGLVPNVHHLRLTLVSHLDGLIIAGQDRSHTLAREAHHQDRTADLIHQNRILDDARRSLESESDELRDRLRQMERAARYDVESGLPNRSHFLERAGAEFQRCWRYDHILALIVVEVEGLQEFLENENPDTIRQIMTCLGQISEAACRAGIDCAGRISEKRIAILLPETTLAGGLMFGERLRNLVAQTPVDLGDRHIRFGVTVAVEAVQHLDVSFSTVLARAIQTLEGNSQNG